MKKLLITTALFLVTSTVSAQCFHSGDYTYCDDGTSYTEQRHGNSTDTYGYNSNTGSRWSQRTDTIGNTTFESGRAANGQIWNQTIQQIGDHQYRSGMDSDGKYFSKICDEYGCN